MDNTGPDLDAARQRLHALREEICALMAETQEELRPVELDQTLQGRLSRMDAMQRREMAKEAQRRRQRELERIDAALERIETGDYGHCAGCDEPIAAERLAFDPAAPLCRDCAGAA